MGCEQAVKCAWRQFLLRLTAAGTPQGQLGPAVPPYPENPGAWDGIGAGGGADEWGRAGPPTRVAGQGAAAVAGSPQATEGCGEMWPPETGPTVGTLARFWRLRKLTISGKEGEFRGQERDKGALCPSMPWAQPQVLREGGQLLLRWYK